MKGGTILIGLFLVFCLFFGYQYNSVKSARLNVDAAYGQVENQMQRRADLIPNLVNTVKGYMKHEEAQIKAVTDARARLMNAGSPEELVPLLPIPPASSDFSSPQAQSTVVRSRADRKSAKIRFFMNFSFRRVFPAALQQK